MHGELQVCVPAETLDSVCLLKHLTPSKIAQATIEVQGSTMGTA